MSDAIAASSRPRAARAWPIPLALVVLSVIPLTAGVLRLVQLAGGPAAIPADDRFSGLPVALVVHILGAAVFAVLDQIEPTQKALRVRPPARVGHQGCVVPEGAGAHPTPLEDHGRLDHSYGRVLKPA